MPIRNVYLRSGDIEIPAAIVMLDNDKSAARKVIEARLRYIDNKLGVESGSILRVDDSAYREIEDLTEGNPGFVLYIMRRLLPRAEQLEKTRPYVITGEHVKQLHTSKEEFEAWWDSPLKNATVIELKPWYEQE